MKVIVDGKCLEEISEGVLKDSLAKIREEAKKRNLMIKSISLDGKVVGGDEIGAMESSPVSQHGELSIDTMDPVVAMRDLLTMVGKNYTYLNSAMENAYQKLSQGNAAEALKDVNLFSNLLQSVIIAFELSSRTVNVKVSTMIVDGKPVSADLVEMRDNLMEFLKALNSSDTVAMADVLKYRLIPHSARIEVIIDHVLKQLS